MENGIIQLDQNLSRNDWVISLQFLRIGIREITEFNTTKRRINERMGMIGLSQALSFS